MKIIREKDDNPLVAVTLRIPKDLLKRVTELAEKNDVARQRLVAEILKQALDDKNFQLRIKE
jgi:predicted transcriptional regulator